MIRHWPVVLAAVTLLFVNPYVRGDGNGYYAWLVSPVIDHDVDFTNQFARGETLFRDRYLDAGGRPYDWRVTPAGHVENQWSVGPALMWAPWFLAAHAAVTLARRAGSSVAADGYSWPYRWSCAVGTAVYGWIGLWCAWSIAVRLGVTPTVARVAVLAAWAASPLPVYQFFLPFHVHALAACAVAVFVWWRVAGLRAQTMLAWAIWGALGGLMVEVYHVNAAALVLVPFAIVELARERGRAALWPRMSAAISMAAIAWLPQAIGKAVVYGTPWTTGYRDGFTPLAPALWSTLFSTNHGALLWTPIFAAGISGLVWLARTRREGWEALAILAALWYGVASFENWHGLSSFGNRFFVSATVLFAVGLAVACQRLRASGIGRYRAAVGVMCALTLWNVGLAFQWGTEMIPTRGPVSIARVARQQFVDVPRDIGAFAVRYVSRRSETTRAIEAKDLDLWLASHR